MQLKTILNRIEKFKSFVYGKVRLDEKEGRLTLLVEVSARANGQAICSGCGHRRPGYDTQWPPLRWTPFFRPKSGSAKNQPALEKGSKRSSYSS